MWEQSFNASELERLPILKSPAKSPFGKRVDGSKNLEEIIFSLWFFKQESYYLLDILAKNIYQLKLSEPER